MAKQKDALGGDGIPDTKVSAKKSSGLISIWRFRLFRSRLSMCLLLIPLIGFNPETTLAILAGFAQPALYGAGVSRNG